jgi:hypothetical protein
MSSGTPLAARCPYFLIINPDHPLQRTEILTYAMVKDFRFSTGACGQVIQGRVNDGYLVTISFQIKTRPEHVTFSRNASLFSHSSGLGPEEE